MNQKVVGGAEHGPQGRKAGADNSLDVSPLIAVIPQAYLGYLQAENTGNIFNHRHTDCHNKEQHDPVPKCALKPVQVFQTGNQKEKTEAEAIERKIRTDTKTGVNPFPFWICGRDKAAEKQLQHPADYRTDKK